MVPRVQDTEENRGLVQRCAKTITEIIDRIKKQRKITMTVSFLEIYNERIFDLLNGTAFKKKKGQQPTIIQDPNGLKLKWNDLEHYQVENLFTFECTTYEDILKLFHEGIKNKIIGSHKMNLSSSRSHSIFTITLEQIDPNNPDNIITSKL